MAIPDWRQIQKEATIVDLHIHPSMQQQIFNRNLNARYVMNRTIHGNPMSVRASFPRLRDGGYDVILSTLHVPEPTLITVQPWDVSQIHAIERAILASDLGITPSNDGRIIRIPIPPLTHERRQTLAKHLG